MEAHWETKGSELHWLSVQRSVKDVPLWINRLVIGPMVGQTAALRLANRLASPLYYCVVKDTHTHAHTLVQTCTHEHASLCALAAEQASRQHRYKEVV